MGLIAFLREKISHVTTRQHECMSGPVEQSKQTCNESMTNPSEGMNTKPVDPPVVKNTSDNYVSKIDRMANNFLLAYAASQKEEMLLISNQIINEINKDTYQFKRTANPYLVAKALYYIWNSDCSDSISDIDGCSLIRLAYYSILKYYHNNHSSISSVTEYIELISACELGVVLMLENPEFIMYTVLSGQLLFLPNYSQKHFRNQIILFGGVVKEAHMNHCRVSLDTSISHKYKLIVSDVESQFPIDTELVNLRNSSIGVIKDICVYLEGNFDYKDDDELFW